MPFRIFNDVRAKVTQFFSSSSSKNTISQVQHINNLKSHIVDVNSEMVEDAMRKARDRLRL